MTTMTDDKTTLSLNESTLERFNAMKKRSQARIGRRLTADDLMNRMLAFFETLHDIG